MPSADGPGSESVQVRELFGEARSVDPEFGLIVLVPTPEGVDAATSERRATRVTMALRAEPLVADVRSYYGTRDPTLVTANRRATYGGWTAARADRAPARPHVVSTSRLSRSSESS